MSPFSITVHKAFSRWPWVVLIITLCFAMAYCQTQLLVCLPGKQNTQRLQSGFDALLGPGKAVVLGRIKDLDALAAENPNAAVLSSGMYFNFLSGYSSLLVGKKKTQTDEKFLMVSASKDLSLKDISGKKVGIIEFLLKDRLAQFVREQFKLSDAMLKRVNKEDDLLTMLGMEAVDAIIVSASQYDDIRSNTKLPLTVIATSENNIGFAVCAAKNGKMDPAVEHALLKAPLSVLKELGIDSWEKQ